MLLEVGRVDKPHGLRGEVIVSLSTNRSERVEPGTALTLEDGRTLVIESSKPMQHRWIVRFEGVDGREAADALHGKTLYAEPLDDPDALWVHELIGATVVDVHDNELGTVESVQDNPASDLLVLGDGGLIPLRFVVSTDAGRIVVDIPAGLLD